MLILDQINLINPHVKHKEVIAKTISKSCKQYHIPCNIYTAILAQESMFRTSPKGGDHGMSQIYHVTAKAYKLNKHRLKRDFKYAIKAGAMILSDFKKRYKDREPLFWWTRYNSSKTKHRVKYKKLVDRYRFLSENTQ